MESNTKPPDKSECKRPDKALKRLESKNTVQTIVKLCLRKALRQDKNAIIDAITNRVKVCSERLKYGSLSLMWFLKERFEGQEDILSVKLPDIFDQTFIRQLLLGTASARKGNPDVEAFFKKHPNMLASEIKHLGDTNIYSFAANKYLTNLQNSLFMNFKTNVKSFSRVFVRFHNLDKAMSVILQFLIHGWSLTPKQRDIEIPEFVLREVSRHRSFLGLNSTDQINMKWLKESSRRERLLKYYIFLNRFHESHKGQPFNIVPIASYGISYITLDTQAFHGMLVDASVFERKVTLETFLKFPQMYWKRFVDVVKYQGKYNKFTGTIDTDGTSICIHYTRPKTAKDDISNEKKPKIDPKKVRVLGGDPGRRTLIHFVEVLEDGSLREYTLTSQQYYKESGLIKARNKTKTWSRKIQRELRMLSKASSKGVSLQRHEAFMEAFFKTYKTLQHEYMKPRWARQRLRTYGGKKRTLANFFNRIEKDDIGKRIIIAYGAAKFAPGGKGEITVPTHAVYKACSARFETFLVDEHRSSKIWNKTDIVLHDVKMPHPSKKGKFVDVRGLKWTGTQFVNRDTNAALNILRCFLANKRPKMLRYYKKALPTLTAKIIKRQEVTIKRVSRVL